MEKDIIARIEPLADELLEKLRAEKKRHGYTIADIAEGTGIQEDNVSKFFNGKLKNPNVYNVMAICIFHGVSLDEALGNPSSPPTDTSMEVLQRDHKLELYEERIAHHEDTIHRLDIALKNRRTLIYSLLALCSVMAVALLCYFGVDATNLDFGFVRHSGVSPVLILVVLTLALALTNVIIVAAKALKKRTKKDDKDGTTNSG